MFLGREFFAKSGLVVSEEPIRSGYPTWVEDKTGHVYPSSVWVQKFGLPPSEDLNGLDLEIKSIFIRPFSVMHPKFVIVDRRYLYLPSCNVSWENWFEGCLQISGPIVNHFLEFWRDFWASHSDKASDNFAVQSRNEMGDVPAAFNTKGFQPPSSQAYMSSITSKKFQINLSGIQSAFLLSSHRTNPQFRPFPWQSAARPPQTPLNVFLLHAFNNAKSSIYVQTPNVTSPPVLEALLAALGRGVDVHIITSERLMILEQLITAGTSTTRCLKQLKRQFITLLTERQKRLMDEEQGSNSHIGSLKIEYFIKRSSDNGLQLGPEPVQTHLKLTIVDEATVIFGSGNMDRASWYTSQELGQEFLDTHFKTFRHRFESALLPTPSYALLEQYVTSSVRIVDKSAVCSVPFAFLRLVQITVGKWCVDSLDCDTVLWPPYGRRMKCQKSPAFECMANHGHSARINAHPLFEQYNGEQ
ncbi:MAG: hypothetical protein Q9157_000416 [Trypethelium eluteriae]